MLYRKYISLMKIENFKYDLYWCKLALIIRHTKRILFLKRNRKFKIKKSYSEFRKWINFLIISLKAFLFSIWSAKALLFIYLKTYIIYLHMLLFYRNTKVFFLWSTTVNSTAWTGSKKLALNEIEPTICYP